MAKEKNFTGLEGLQGNALAEAQRREAKFERESSAGNAQGISEREIGPTVRSAVEKKGKTSEVTADIKAYAEHGALDIDNPDDAERIAELTGISERPLLARIEALQHPPEKTTTDKLPGPGAEVVIGHPAAVVEHVTTVARAESHYPKKSTQRPVFRKYGDSDLDVSLFPPGLERFDKGAPSVDNSIADGIKPEPKSR